MKISIGADHRGYSLKQYLMKMFPSIEWTDVGTLSDERCDYPYFAHKVAHLVGSGQVPLGILVCGSGIGMSIAANRHPHVYASLCWHEHSAQAARHDDGANVLVLPADFVNEKQAQAIVEVWLSTSFQGGIYQERRAMIDMPCCKELS
jgi:ribose 5-phosphate isomerase B